MGLIGTTLTGVALAKLAVDAAEISALARPFWSAIRSSAQRHGISPALLAAVIYKESRFDPSARGSSGEVGLGQFMPAAAQDVGTSIEAITDNPEAQVDAAAAFLALQLRRADGNLLTAIRSYNAGFAGATRDSALALPYALDVLRLASLIYAYESLAGRAV